MIIKISQKYNIFNALNFTIVQLESIMILNDSKCSEMLCDNFFLFAFDF